MDIPPFFYSIVSVLHYSPACRGFFVGVYSSLISIYLWDPNDLSPGWGSGICRRLEVDLLWKQRGRSFEFRGPTNLYYSIYGRVVLLCSRTETATTYTNDSALRTWIGRGCTSKIQLGLQSCIPCISTSRYCFWLARQFSVNSASNPV